MPSHAKNPAQEKAKRVAAARAVAEHFPKDPRYVGIGSGTTIVYVVDEILKLGQDVSRVSFIPTGYQSKMLVRDAGLTSSGFDELPDGVELDIAFDGADEVDDDMNCIKGGGACLFQEKLVAMKAKEFICVADYTKLSSRLLTNWAYIPIEVAPIAAHHVIGRLSALGSEKATIRGGPISKASPLKTDQDFFIVDAVFPQLLLTSDITAEKEGKGKHGIWEVEALAKAIKSIPGVLEVGIFSGPTGPEAAAAGVVGGQKPVAAYFGMEDGSVQVRKAKPRS